MVDNPLASNFAMNTALEDFFNFEMLAGPSSGGPSSSSSRSSSNSPEPSFVALPPTPPNPFETTVDTSSSLFDFYLDHDELIKVDPHLMPPTSAAPFDFLGAFPPSAGNSPVDDLSTTSPSSGDSPTTIDPQLMDTPSTLARPHSEFGDEDGEDGDDDVALDEEEEEALFAAVKVGGKGKDRKGTVHSGGIVKKSGGGKDKDAKVGNAGMLSTTSNDPEDWRPTPEEYKKMSSKEKRQLRNKISARNFRVRRKEYISTLEGDIAERDRLIDAIRGELGSTKSENLALRQEISALKKALLEGRGRMDTPVLPPPAPLPSVSPASALKSPSATPKSPLLTPNVHKDLPMSPRLAGRGFWGGNLTGGFGGITPVHTTLVPDLSSVLSGKPDGRRVPVLQENLNPLLNGQMPAERTMELSLPASAFDSFTDMNPFTMKTIDAYRMQLWTRMGQQQVANPQNGQNSASSSRTNSPQSSPPSGLASGMRPHYFSKSSTLSTILAGKSTSSSFPSAHSSVLNPTSKANSTPQPTAQQAMLATMASQTLLGKLGSAFWDAFSGQPAAGAARSQWDADKVRKVLEGKAVVRVVDVESAPTPISPPAPVALNEKVGPSRLATPKTPSIPEKPKCGALCLDKMLEGLHL